MFSKKGLGSVVIIAFLIVFIILFVIFFQNWYQNYNTTLMNDIEYNSQDSISVSGLDKIVDGKLYFENNKNKEVFISKVTISGRDCGIIQNASVGFNSIDIKRCVRGIEGSPGEVLVQTNQGLYIDTLFLDVKPPYINNGIVGFLTSDNDSFDNNEAKGITLEVDFSDNIYVGGDYSGILSLEDGNSLSDLGNKNFFLLKYDSSNNLEWAVSPVSGVSNIKGSATDSMGNVYIIGEFTSNTLDLGSGFVLINNQTSGTSKNIFIIKYDSLGNLLNAITVSSQIDHYEYSNDIHVDSNGNIYITGTANGILNFGNGVVSDNTHFFLVKYNSSFDAQWVSTTSSSLGGSEITGISIIEKNNDIYVGGIYSSENIIFADKINLTNSGIPGNTFDFFLVKYNSSGNPQFVKSANGSIYGSERVNDIEIDYFGNIYIYGNYNNGDYLNFSDSFKLNSSDSNDIFLVKYDSSGEILDLTSSTVIPANNNMEYSSKMTIDLNTDDLYITGYFSTTEVDFGNGNNLTNPGGNSFFLVKYNSSLESQWARTSDNINEDIGTDIGITSFGRVFLTGYFKGDLGIQSFNLVNTLYYDFFLVKYN